MPNDDVLENAENTEVSESAKETINMIVQNGVSKDELQSMLTEILGSKEKELSQADIEKAEHEYFSSFLKY